MFALGRGMYICMYVCIFVQYVCIYTDDLISEVYIQNLFMLYSMFVWQYDAIVIYHFLRER